MARRFLVGVRGAAAGQAERPEELCGGHGAAAGEAGGEAGGEGARAREGLAVGEEESALRCGRTRADRTPPSPARSLTDSS